MNDLISRQAAIEIVERYNKSHMVLKQRPMLGAASIVIELKELPPAQLDIIRCKDCAYCDSDVVDAPYGMTEKIFWCDRLYAGANENLIVEPDDFCSWAERRTDG